LVVAHDEGELGEIMRTHRVEGSDDHGLFRYELEHCTLGTVSTRGIRELEAELRTYRVRRTAAEPGERAWLTQWYLNAPRNELIYTRLVRRERRETYRRERENPRVEDAFGENWHRSSGRHAFVETPDFGFVVERVPKELGPRWSRGLAIEYRDEWGDVPDEGTRESVANCLGFVMGRPLIGVGHTAFDERGFAIEDVALAPSSDTDLASLCRQGGQPPVRLDSGGYTDILESLLGGLVPRYLELNAEFDLDDVLWGYWLFGRLPLGANLPVLATSLEMLKRDWYSSRKSKSRGVYMPKKEFDDLLGDELAVVEEKLAGVEYGDRIARRMRSAFNLGANESMEFFFEELGLPIGPLERAALRARNPMAHGSAELLDEGRHQEMFDNTQSYRTLFNRVLLKLLGYDGAYVDYSARGWPERPLDEPLGGRG
jgi:hypothetical protein